MKVLAGFKLEEMMVVMIKPITDIIYILWPSTDRDTEIVGHGVIAKIAFISIFNFLFVCLCYVML